MSQCHFEEKVKLPCAPHRDQIMFHRWAQSDYSGVGHESKLNSKQNYGWKKVDFRKRSDMVVRVSASNSDQKTLLSFYKCLSITLTPLKTCLFLASNYSRVVVNAKPFYFLDLGLKLLHNSKLSKLGWIKSKLNKIHILPRPHELLFNYKSKSFDINLGQINIFNRFFIPCKLVKTPQTSS